MQERGHFYFGLTSVKKFFLVGLVAVGAMASSAVALAVEPWATIQAAVDFTAVITTLGVIAGALFAVFVIIKGIRIVMSLIR